MGRKKRTFDEVHVQDLATHVGTLNMKQLEKILTRYEDLTPAQARSAVQAHFKKYENCTYEAKLSGISVWACDLNRYLERMKTECSTFFNAVLSMVSDNRAVIPVVLYHDACQGGNVLSPNPSFKVNAVYLAFGHLPQECLRSPQFWLTIGLLDHNHASTIPGNIGSYMQVFVEQFRNGVFLGHQGPRLEIAAWIGDYEAQRSTFSSRGSAGLLPCLFCANVVSESSNLASSGNGFLVDLKCNDPAHFSVRSDVSIFSLCDALAELKTRTTKQAFETKCKSCGLTFDPNGLLWNANLRTILPPSKVLNVS